MRTDENAIRTLQEALDAVFSEREWLRILELFAPTGIADSLHLRTSTGMERTRLQRVLDKMQALSSGLPPVLHLLDHTIARTGQRGRLPNIYLLGETGSALLRANGYLDAHPCELGNDHAMAHALCMLDVHLSARKHNLEVHTDRVISYRDVLTLRPDHQVILKDGTKLILEVEQLARRELVQRISGSLRHKQTFFESPESIGYHTDIRMILNVSPGHMFARTCNLWRSVIDSMREELDKRLNFRLLAISLVDFLLDPEWETDASQRWWDLTKIPMEKKETESRAENKIRIQVTMNSKEDLVLLSALYQALQEDPDATLTHYIDLYFLEVMLKIYEASHPDDLKSRLLWKPPHYSLSLLKDYFDLHPELRTRLRASMHQNISKWSWNSRTILHRMQRVIDTFLAYYGWKSNTFLSVRAVYGDDSGSEPFKVSVSSVGFFWGGYEESRRKLAALEWVLMALFRYADELGLGRPKFW
jgi:hypothetical protein